jgi:hypothetical protein
MKVSPLDACGSAAAAGADAEPQGHHWETPPWREQVPLWCSLWESVPSAQIAVTFDGELSGRSTQSPLEP